MGKFPSETGHGGGVVAPDPEEGKIVIQGVAGDGREDTPPSGKFRPLKPDRLSREGGVVTAE
jgi:hypothetical protein